MPGDRVAPCGGPRPRRVLRDPVGDAVFLRAVEVVVDAGPFVVPLRQVAPELAGGQHPVW